MSKKVFLTSLLVLALAVAGVLAVGSSSQVEACITCVNGNCETGGTGSECSEMHWSNGSSVCQWVSGCDPVKK